MKNWCIAILNICFLGGCSTGTNELTDKTSEILAQGVLSKAEWAMNEQPVTITDFISQRSAGSINDFYSEGDYWWPDSENPNGPYIRRDGESNPDNFVAHRHAMIRFSTIVGTLISAYIITEEEKYARHAMRHIDAWLINPTTRMDPHLKYAQAIKGRVTGRGIGIIDTIHLMEVAQAIYHLKNSKELRSDHLQLAINWFEAYLKWLTTHPYSIEEKNTQNNHASCWVMQVATFARLTGNEKLMDECRMRYKTVLIPNQMALDGSFPLETQRTKPYAYSLFNLDAMATICQILSNEEDNLWEYTFDNTRGIKLGVDYMLPFVRDKNQWPFQKDVMYWEDWPVAHPFLIFAAVAYKNHELFEVWSKLNHDPVIDEVIRNLPIRNPLLWL